MKGIVASVLRALLWIVVLVAPGGLFLLPLLVGDAMVQRKRRAQDSVPDGAGLPVPSPLSTR
jgi:hypothetical protein